VKLVRVFPWGTLGSMRERFARWICRHFHRAITRPVNGQYECLRCQRRFPVGWHGPTVRDREYQPSVCNETR
jgi:hypothetical protein